MEMSVPLADGIINNALFHSNSHGDDCATGWWHS